MNASSPSGWPRSVCCREFQCCPALCESFPVVVSLFGHETRTRTGSPQVISVVFPKPIALVRS